jgi:hypothetical protein
MIFDIFSQVGEFKLRLVSPDTTPYSQQPTLLTQTSTKHGTSMHCNPNSAHLTPFSQASAIKKKGAFLVIHLVNPNTY